MEATEAAAAPASAYSSCHIVEDYGDKLRTRLSEFRKNNLYYDVTLKMTAGEEMCAHKVVLVACGGVFR